MAVRANCHLDQSTTLNKSGMMMNDWVKQGFKGGERREKGERIERREERKREKGGERERKREERNREN